jgi:hypothetical protein
MGEEGTAPWPPLLQTLEDLWAESEISNWVIAVEWWSYSYDDILSLSLRII